MVYIRSSSSSTASGSTLTATNNNISALSSRRSSPPPSPIGSISFLEYGKLRFIINDCPTDNNLQDYIKEFKKHNVQHVVRVCQPTYSDAALIKEDIQVHCLMFEDGGTPPDSVVKQWLSLVQQVFDGNYGDAPAIAVHCVAGLGRAPVLVALALIEFGMDKLDAVSFVRTKRRGAFNNRQIQYLAEYKKISCRPSIKLYLKKLMVKINGNKKSENRSVNEQVF
jgi:protein tyrosine phosphatase type IVA